MPSFQIIMMAAMLLALYAFIVIPQNRRDRKKKDMLAALEVGDEIVTNSGIYGVVTDFDGPTVFVAIDNGVEIKLVKDAIADKVDYDEEED